MGLFARPYVGYLLLIFTSHFQTDKDPRYVVSHDTCFPTRLSPDRKTVPHLLKNCSEEQTPVLLDVTHVPATA